MVGTGTSATTLNSITVVLEQKRFVQPINSPVKEVHVLICHMCVIILMTVGTNRMKLIVQTMLNVVTLKQIFVTGYRMTLITLTGLLDKERHQQLYSITISLVHFHNFLYTN
jgi:hypothetical protein